MKCFNVYIDSNSEDMVSKLSYYLKNFYPLFTIVKKERFINRKISDNKLIEPDLIFIEISNNLFDSNDLIRNLLLDKTIVIGITNNKVFALSAIKNGLDDCLEDVNDFEKLSQIMNKVYNKLIVKKFLLKE